MVINLAVLKGHDLAVSTEQRLSPARNINDREPPHSHDDAGVDVFSATVWTASFHRGQQSSQERSRPSGFQLTEHTDNATHGTTTCLRLARLLYARIPFLTNDK